VTGSPARGEGAENYFAPRAEQYAEFRPRYPAELHAWLARICDRNSVAWDCATGNGQAAIGLADHFDRVVATDPSAAMIANALPHPRITYVVARYESGLPDRAADLVTVAQALHWFNLAAFLTEARRVLVTGGVLAAWCYALCRIEPAIDTIVDHYYAVTLAPFWPPERRYVDDGYRSFVLPLDEFAPPPFHISESWTADDFMRYVRTWSGTNRCIAATGEGPLRAFEATLRREWGEPISRKPVRWPIHFRIGRFH
jgi:SAM-dependent methyltransferase